MLRRPLFALAAWLILTTHAAAQPAPVPTCSGDLKPWLVAELLFGRTNVNERQWARFLSEEATPRFPVGFTVLDGKGQWRAPGGTRIVRERSSVLMIAMPPATDTDARLRALMDAYKTRFRQQSVGLIVKPACVSF